MREIKFRAWNTEEKILIYFLYMHITYDETLVFDTFKESTYLDETFDRTTEFILMQYTGLRDKNDKEIYEGDILKCKWGQSNQEPVYQNRIVSFNQDKNTFVWTLQDKRDFENKWEGAFNQWNQDEIEVMGNIYENPKLLKEVK